MPRRPPVSSVPIAGINWEVVAEDLGDDHGQMDFDNNRLLINPADFGDIGLFRKDLVHEAFHASLAISGLDWMMSGRLNEAVTRCMENIFLPAIDAITDSCWRVQKRRSRRTRRRRTRRKGGT